MKAVTRKYFLCVVVFVSLAATVLLAGCSTKPQYYRSDLVLEEKATLAVLPLVNLTKYTEAGDILMNSLLVALLDLNMFEIVDPGLVDNLILEKRIRYTDRLPMSTMEEMGQQLDAEYILLGSVNEFEMVMERTETLPVISISLRIVGSQTGTIVWAATHTKRGDDTESVFGMGRITTLHQLAAVTTKEITGTLKK